MGRAFLTWSFVLTVLLALLASGASAHPSSGIVVDDHGSVFVADIATGLWKIDASGTVTHLYNEAGHWLALDAEGRFSRMDFSRSSHWPRWFKRRTPTGVTPALITDGGSPLVVHPDGNLYYVSSGDKLVPGGHEIARLSPLGKIELLLPHLSEKTEKLGGIKGLAVGPDGSLYAACPSAVLKIGRDGAVTTLVYPIVLDNVETDLPPGTPTDQKPFLRGLAVDSRGTVYAAGSGCRCLLKITPGGKADVILKAEAPWSPTGVVVRGDNVYVLEYTNANSEDDTAKWLPRVRKLGRDRKVITLAAISTGSE